MKKKTTLYVCITGHDKDYTSPRYHVSTVNMGDVEGYILVGEQQVTLSFPDEPIDEIADSHLEEELQETRTRLLSELEITDGKLWDINNKGES